MMPRILGSALAVTVGFIALRFLLTPIRINVITHVLQPGDYGAVTLLSMTAHGLALVVSLGGFEVLLRKMPGLGKPQQNAYFRKVLMVSSLGGLSVCVMLWLIWNRAHWLGDIAGLIGPVTAILFFLLFLHALQRIHYMLGRREHGRARFTQLLWSDLWFLPILLLMSVVAWNAERVVWAWSAWLLVTMLVTWCWTPLGGILKDRSNLVSTKEVLAFGLPVLPVLLSDWVFRLVGHYVLLIHADAATMALYALALNVSLIGLVAGVPLIDLCSVDLSKIMGHSPQRYDFQPSLEERTIFSRGIRHIIAVSLPVMLLLVFMAEDIIGFLAGPAFQAAANLLPWASALPVLLLFNLFFARVLLLQGESAIVSAGSVVGAILALILCIFLVPRMGSHGALMAITCAAVMVVIIYATRMRIWRWLESQGIAWGGVLMGGLILIGGFGWSHLVQGGGLFRLMVMGLFSLVVLVGSGMIRVRDFHGASS